MIGILVDVTRCTDCNECVDACAEAHNLGKARLAPQQVGDGLSSVRWSAIVSSPEGQPVRKFCRHCIDPACVSVCPVGAMIKTENGPVVYDPQKCMGCRYCMMACPYGIPRYEWDSAAPMVQKCNLCADRLEQGLLPMCVESCSEKALIFGERDELLELAHQRIAEEPSRYLPEVVGENDAGGSSVLYLSNIPLDFLNFSRDPGEAPLPELSWNWLSKVPGISLATAGLMTGLFWIIGRRMQVEEARLAHSSGKES